MKQVTDRLSFVGSSRHFLYLFGLLIFSAAFFVSAADQMDGRNIIEDPDQDGLTTAEESAFGTDPSNRDTDGDGYSDGVEVNGGYDPLKKAPGDKIVPENMTSTGNAVGVGGDNLTEQAAQEIAALVQGAAQSGEDGESVSLEDLSKLAQNITDSSSEEVVLPEVDMDSIKIKKQSYKDLSKSKREEKIKEDIEEYLTTVAYLFANNSPADLKTTDDLESVSDDVVSEAMLSLSVGNFSQLNALAENGKKILDQIYEIEVPEQMLDVHVKAIKLAKYAADLQGELSVTSNEDPVKTISTLSKTQGLLNVLVGFTAEVESKVAEYGISEIPLEL